MNLRQSNDMQLKHVLSVVFKRKSQILYFLGLTVAVVAAYVQNILRAERDGTVKAVSVKAGDSVAADEVLVEFA